MNYCNCPNCATDDCPAAKKADNGTTHWNGTTHYAGCIQSGVAHYECALQEIGRLRGTIMDLRVKLEASKGDGMSDTSLVRKYIDSVDGMAHQSAIEIIINLEKKLEAAGTYEDGYENGYQAGMAEKKEWVGLTDIEAADCWSTSAVTTWENFEAKLKEKNGG